MLIHRRKRIECEEVHPIVILKRNNTLALLSQQFENEFSSSLSQDL